MEDLKKFYGWTERKLKGNIAETIVEHMLQYSGYKVYRFGYERTLEKLKDIKLLKSFEKKKITYMPDFVIVGENGDIHFVEVKYRERGMTDYRDRQKIENLGKTWPDARLIIVSLISPHFSISRVKEFIKTHKLYNLGEDKFIKIDKDILKRYENLVIKYYKNT